MILRILFAAFLLISGASLASAQEAKPMSNQDVINLVGAKISENTIILAVRGSKSAFDVSANGLIKLSQSGVSDKIIQAMIEANSVKTGKAERAPAIDNTPAASRSAVASGSFNPEELVLMDGDQKTAMHYFTPQTRMAARAMGFGGMAQYAVLRGTQANLRIKNRQPSFVMAVPSNAQPDSYNTLANLAVRHNNTREIMIGGGYMSYSSGVSVDRVIATSSEKLADQSNAPAGYVLYRVTPKTMLTSGEYAMIFYNSQIRVVGFFSAGLDSYFDFGVDD